MSANTVELIIHRRNGNYDAVWPGRPRQDSLGQRCHGGRKEVAPQQANGNKDG
jgi:hypothetical protein